MGVTLVGIYPSQEKQNLAKFAFIILYQSKWENSKVEYMVEIGFWGFGIWSRYSFISKFLTFSAYNSIYVTLNNIQSLLLSTREWHA